MSRMDAADISAKQVMVAGALLFVGAAGWLAMTAATTDGSSLAAAELIALSGLVLAVSWMMSARHPMLVPLAVVCAAIALIVADPGTVLRYSPLQGPFGYANATAAFYAQAVVAALILSMAGRTILLRTGGGIVALALASVVVISRSWTVLLLLPTLVPLAIVLGRARGSQAVAIACGGLFVGVLATTVVLGAWGGGSGGSVDRLVRSTISEQRVDLWHDALTITAEHPVLGVGPGRFASVSPIASSDRDLRWAHNEFLQTAAEAGLLGFALAVSVFLWGFFALWATPPHLVAALAGAALALLGIQASLDHVLRFPEVALIGAAVLGSGLGAPVALRARDRVVSLERPEPEGAV